MKTVLIVLDTLRRNHLSCYGYERKTSLNIDRLAKEGVVFDNEYTSNVPTIPSFTAMLNGRLGIKTGVVSFDRSEILADKLQSLPYILARNGITTAAVSTLFYMRPNLVRGFQQYFNPLAGVRERTQTIDAEEINSTAIPWIRRNCNEDFFFFVHYWDPHVESVWGKPHVAPRYRAPEQFKDLYYEGQPTDLEEREYVISQYDANITYADQEIGRLLETLEEVGITDETLVVFTTDHGENLGDDHPMGKNLWDHLDIYENVIHTPLIMKYPKCFPKDVRIGPMVENLDIAPTILNMYEIPVPEDFDGRSLLPLINAESSRKAQETQGYQEVIVSTGFATCKRAIVTSDKLKLIRTFHKGGWPDSPEKEFYDLKEDLAEERNLINERKDLADDLETRMLKWVDRMLGNKPDPLKMKASRTPVRRIPVTASPS